MPPRGKKGSKKRTHSPEASVTVDKTAEVHARLAEIELEVERRCQEIQMNNKVFIESLKATFATHMLKFPKATRAMSTEEFFGEEVQQFDDVRAKAEFILMSACKPGRPPLTQARPGPSAAPAPSIPLGPIVQSNVPASAVKAPRPPRGFETPKLASKTMSAGLSTPVGAAPETPVIVASVYISKIKSLEDELKALKAKYEGMA